MKKCCILLFFVLFSVLSLGQNQKVKEVEPFVTHVTLTTYNPVASQCSGNPLHTADGTHIDLKKLKQKKIKYVAVSRDLLWILPYGSIIEIEGHGRYEVHDTMSSRFDHCIDILQHIDEQGFKKVKVKITKIK